MRDHLSQSKVIETELAKPLFDALLRVALGNHSADFEHHDAMTEKVWIRQLCRLDMTKRGRREWDGTRALMNVFRTHGPGFGQVSSGGSISILWDEQYLLSALSHKKQESNVTCFFFIYSGNWLRISETEMYDLISLTYN